MGGSNGRVGPGRPLLAKLVQEWEPGQGSHWPTPRASAQENRGTKSYGRTGGKALAEEACEITNRWNTPQVSPPTYMRSGGKVYDLLPNQAAKWATPRAEERQQYNSADKYEALSLQVTRWPTSELHRGRRVPTTQTGGESTSGTSPTTPRRLNPMFVEALMGWPIHWSIPYTLQEVAPGLEGDLEQGPT